MGKVFITDESNPGYTVHVTNGGIIREASDSCCHRKLASAAASASVVLSSTACWLESVIIGGQPATGTVLALIDTSGTVASSLAYDTTGASWNNLITKITMQSAAATGAGYAQSRTIPINVYCASGLTYALGYDGALMGNHANITICYSI